jgi:hypothetical protein
MAKLPVAPGPHTPQLILNTFPSSSDKAVGFEVPKLRAVTPRDPLGGRWMGGASPCPVQVRRAQSPQVTSRRGRGEGNPTSGSGQ